MAKCEVETDLGIRKFYLLSVSVKDDAPRIWCFMLTKIDLRLHDGSFVPRIEACSSSLQFFYGNRLPII